MTPLQDFIYIELLDTPQKGTIQVIGEQAVRCGKILSVGPGAMGKLGGRKKPDVSEGDTVWFFMAHLQTKQGKAILERIDDNHGLLREADILFVGPPELEVGV